MLWGFFKLSLTLASVFCSEITALKVTQPLAIAKYDLLQPLCALLWLAWNMRRTAVPGYIQAQHLKHLFLFGVWFLYPSAGTVQYFLAFFFLFLWVLDMSVRHIMFPLFVSRFLCSPPPFFFFFNYLHGHSTCHYIFAATIKMKQFTSQINGAAPESNCTCLCKAYSWVNDISSLSCGNCQLFTPVDDPHFMMTVYTKIHRIFYIFCQSNTNKSLLFYYYLHARYSKKLF